MSKMKKKFKLALIEGKFTVLHPGHVRLFRHAKELAETLCVAVQSDSMAGETAIVDEDTRLDALISNIYVDQAQIYRGTIEELINDVKPDVMLKGSEFKDVINPEVDALNAIGGELVFHTGGNWHASENILLTRDGAAPDHFQLPEGFLKRHDVSKERLVQFVQSFSSLNTCVVGDLIIDEYVSCHPAGLSREEPTVVVYPYDYSRFVGGAGIVAGHSAGLGATTSLISIVGKDPVAIYAKDALDKYGVGLNLFEDPTRPTTLKQRFRAQNKGLLKVSHLHSSAITDSLQNQILDAFIAQKDQCNVLILSDFNYGCLPQPLVEALISEAKSAGIFVAADSQTSSQSGDVSRFKAVDLLTPTEHEARVALRKPDTSLISLAQELQQVAMVEDIFLSLGEEGVLVVTKGTQSSDWMSDRVPALNAAAVDPAGAGDSMLISGSLTRALGGSIWEASLIGSISAAIQVSRIGNVPLTSDDLLRELRA